MNLEQQVCSIELAKRLKELGIKQESLFYWLDDRDCEDNTCEDCKLKTEIIFSPNIFHENAVTLRDYYSAFTVAELGEMLPSEIEYGASTFNLQFYKLNKIWDGQYFDPDSSYILHGLVPGFVDYYIFDTKEADARAKMLIYLIENKLMDLKDN